MQPTLWKHCLADGEDPDFPLGSSPEYLIVITSLNRSMYFISRTAGRGW